MTTRWLFLRLLQSIANSLMFPLLPVLEGSVSHPSSLGRSSPATDPRITTHYCQVSARAVIGRPLAPDWSRGVASRGRGAARGREGIRHCQTLSSHGFSRLATPAPGSIPGQLIWFQSALSLHSSIADELELMLTISWLVFNWSRQSW